MTEYSHIRNAVRDMMMDEKKDMTKAVCHEVLDHLKQYDPADSMKPQLRQVNETIECQAKAIVSFEKKMDDEFETRLSYLENLTDEF